MRNMQTAGVLMLLLAACTGEPESARDTAAALVDPQAGQAIAESECAGCHGLDGKGRTPEIPNLAAQPAEYLVEALHAYRDGTREHAALRDMTSGMSEADLVSIAAYYASQPPVQPTAEAPDVPAGSSYGEGAAVAALCTECHGEGGVSDTPGVPSLAGQQPVYLIVATQEYRDGSRGHPEKEEMLKDLEQIDIEKMAMYFAAQTHPVREAPPFGDPASGEPLSASCGGCHGERGISHDPMVPSLAAQEPHYLVQSITAYREHEREHEEMMTDKTDEEIANIAAYYAVQKPQRAIDPSAPVQALAAKCDRCHGPAVGKTSLVVPSLNGQNRDYLVKVMKAYRDEDRGSSMMHKMSAEYSDETIEAIAGYYAGQSAE